MKQMSVHITHAFFVHYQDWFTPLMYAADKGHLPVVEYLVERGADMEAKDNVSGEIVHSMSYTYICYTFLNGIVSAWIHAVVACNKKCSSANDKLSGEERG